MYSLHIIKCKNVCVHLDEFWICVYFVTTTQIRTIYITPESSHMLVLFLITQASRLCLIVQDVHCPALEGAIHSRVPENGSFWGCVVHSHRLGTALCPGLMSAHSYKYSDSTDRIKAPLAHSLHWNRSCQFVVILPALYLCIEVIQTFLHSPR